jgi:chemotaxis response regulator CheB
VGKDGVHGVESIRKAGGKVIVQKPDTCEFPDLPNEIIRRNNADIIATPEEMPTIISELV